MWNTARKNTTQPDRTTTLCDDFFNTFLQISQHRSTSYFEHFRRSAIPTTLELELDDIANKSKRFIERKHNRTFSPAPKISLNKNVDEKRQKVIEENYKNRNVTDNLFFFFSLWKNKNLILPSKYMPKKLPFEPFKVTRFSFPLLLRYFVKYSHLPTD